MNKDLQHIKLLSIFYYVVGGLLALVACFPIIHLVFGLMIVVAPNTMTNSSGAPPPAAMGWIFVLVAGGFILVGWIGAICLIATGWFLQRCKYYLFCMVMAGFACLFNPFGTVLGVFTIVVLLRPSVKQLFETGGRADPSDERDEPPLDYEDHITRDSYNIRR